MVVERELPDGTKVNVLNVAGVLTVVREAIHKLNNDKKTPYQLGVAEFKYPDNGEVGRTDIRIYTNSIEAHKDVFKEGGKITIEFQTDGPYKGRAIAKLGGETANMARLLGEVKASTVEAKAGEPTVVS